MSVATPKTDRPMDLKSRLIADAEQHCAATGISKARLATIMVNDGKFFTRIENGGDFSVRLFEQFQTYFQEHPGAPAP